MNYLFFAAVFLKPQLKRVEIEKRVYLPHIKMKIKKNKEPVLELTL
jgi:hypothetical protein